MPSRLSDAPMQKLLKINRPEEKINPRQTEGYNQAADNSWPRLKSNDAAHGSSLFFPRGTDRLYGSGIDSRIFAKKQLQQRLFHYPE
jgi:hypothetical protein